MTMEEASNLKRKRGLGIVTQNACTECRKKRAKCDGQKPCGRCTSQKNADCVYEVPVRQSKEHMRAEIESLREHQRQSERVLAALVSRDCSDQVLEEFRNGKTLKAVADQLDGISPGYTSNDGNVTTYNRFGDRQAIGTALEAAQTLPSTTLSDIHFGDMFGSGSDESARDVSSLSSVWQNEGLTPSLGHMSGNEDVVNWSSETLTGSYHPSQGAAVGIWHIPSASPDSTTGFARLQGQEALLGHDFVTPAPNVLATTTQAKCWTAVTDDSDFIEHLLALYFCWEYPTFAPLSKKQFLIDFRDRNAENCSELLVNSLLSLGCRFSTREKARTDPEDPASSGNHFFAEAMRLLALEKELHVLTTVQALSLMSIREASCGRTSHSMFLSGQSIRLAIEMGLHKDADDIGDNPGRDSVRAATFWGAFALDQAWSLTTGKLPQFSRNTKLASKPAVVDHFEASAWVPYTDDGAPLSSKCSQPSNMGSVYKTFCELSEIVHHSLYALYVPGIGFTSHSLIEVYTSFLRWYDAIPAALRLGRNFTPAVLFCHMYYHYAILLLFRPFIKLKIPGSSVLPKDVCRQAADAISTLMCSYYQLYSLRRTPAFVPYFALASSIHHLVVLGNTGECPQHVQQAYADLKEMSICHKFAHRVRSILRSLIERWDIDIEIDDDETTPEDARIANKASAISLNLFCPNLEAADTMTGIGNMSKTMRKESPLFWPFPLQGRPLFGQGDSLENTGFALLV